ncbi:MAG TPA: class I SAM-dependent methyltransferase [Acidimicrobiales bacterium]|nr:class I SAM-dependent methyltransferase [Acidimicrobiales bacterium]
MGTITWGRDIAEVYDATYATQFDPAALEPVLDLLLELAGAGAALELAVGTGRVALPLSGRGVTVSGIELSPPMVEQLQAKPGADAISVTIGDMATTRVPGPFSLVYVVVNTIMNVTTQDEQVAVFENAAAHLEPGGCFVVEVLVPDLRAYAPGHPPTRAFTMDADHLAIETLDDPVGQIASSHHWIAAEGRLVHHTAPYRYVWPAELDLMARVAGLRLRDRWQDWHRTPFTATSTTQVAVYEQPT